MILVRSILWLFAATGLLNGLWMLLFPSHWYHELPADVSVFGPFNQHFVRDVGLAYVCISLALFYAALNPLRRSGFVAGAAFYMTGHAIVHLWDLVQGHIPPVQLKVDLPLVHLPALILLALFIYLRRQTGSKTYSH